MKGLYEKKRISLPPVLTNSFIPQSKAEVASPKTVQAHPHLRRFARNFPQLDESAEVLLLIGRDSGDCMFTRCFGNKTPFAHHTSLGWALVGDSCDNSYANNPIVSTLKTSLHEHFSATPCFEADIKPHLKDFDVFSELPDDDQPGLSQQDQKFLHKMNSDLGINEEGNIVLPLPFSKDKTILPDNLSLIHI